MQKVLVGMSGGVDSTAAVMLLQKEGYEVSGLTLLLHGDEKSARDAAASARTLGISHDILDMRTDFARKVITPFLESYQNGQTPNPCVLCNAQVKLAAMIAYADAHGFDRIATGHYAHVRAHDGRAMLWRGADAKKDQTYFLSMLPAAWISRLLLPLGGLTKDEVRSVAAEALPAIAEKKDSLEICFIPSDDYGAFLESRLPSLAREGKIIDQNGFTVGFHGGVHRYTIGQRKGLGAFGKKVFVTDINAAENTVTIGENDALFSDGLYAENVNFMLENPPEELYVSAKIRSAGPMSPAICTRTARGITLRFDTPQRAITPGQTVALYQGDMLIGGATITRRI